MFSLLIRNLIFTVLQPGIVAGLIPYLILADKLNDNFFQPLKFYHYSGGIVFVTGFITMLTCIISFAVQGRGTLSPADPTKKLVITGLYKFSRNPMYIGVTLILIGETIIFQSIELSLYSLFIFIAFHIFTILGEEPRLRKHFGEEYIRYSKKVRRWI